MRIPTVHINGTNGLELFDQVTFASLAAEHAIDRLRAAWPNGRDYYVQSGDDPLREVHREWNARLDKLETVRKELTEIAEDIGKQLERRGGDPWARRKA